MSNKYLFLLLLLPLLACTGKERQRVFNFRNHNSSVCHVMYAADDPSGFLRIGRRKSLMIIDANGFTVPYQFADSGKVVFMLDIPSGEGKKYTFKATKLKMDFHGPLYYSCLDNGDVCWGNNMCSFFMHSDKVEGNGAGFGFAPDGPGKGGYLFRHSLGCGGIAPYKENHLVRYGNFTKMELLDSGPVLLRMRFTFPDFHLDGKRVHEERTISINPNVRFCKVESHFVGCDGPIPIAICIPFKGEDGLPVDSERESNKRFVPVVQAGRGYMCYAEEGSNDKHGTVFTAVMLANRSRCRQQSMDGHMAIISETDSGGRFDYCIAGASSFNGMNYSMWSSLVESYCTHVRTAFSPTSYDVE